MAIGDVVSGMGSNIADSGTVDYQPAAGVEAMIFGVGCATAGAAPNACPQATVALYDGSDQADHLVEAGGAMWANPLRLMVNNTNYLRIQNTSGGASDVGYWGVQTK